MIQGIINRDEIKPILIDALEKHSDGDLACVSFYAEMAPEIAAHFYKDGHFHEIKIFNFKSLYRTLTGYII